MIQVKCISRGERTDSHTDDLNCMCSGYQKTSTACFTLQDAIGDVWSIKIVTNRLNHAYANLVMDYLGQHFQYLRLRS